MGTTIGIPPNGFAGASQQSAAVRNHIASHSSKALGHTKSVKRKRTKIVTRAKKAPRAKKAKGAIILTAGSAAAKAWGAKMKRLRKAKTKAA